MKNYFLDLFRYDHFANRVILETMNDAGNPAQTARLMAHLLRAQQIWFSRFNNFPDSAGGVWPDWAVDSFAAILAENTGKWVACVGKMTEVDFDRIIRYKTLKGEAFENTSAEILTQVTNHGTHHRAQIGQHLSAAGIKPLPLTDYIFYLRLKQQKQID